MSSTINTQPLSLAGKPDAVRAAAVSALARHSFCTLATTSAAGRPHVVGVGYAVEQDALYVHTIESSRKVRNIRDNPHVAICVPVRRLPLAPPFCVQFQATAEILAVDDDGLGAMIRAGRLKKILAHGALSVPGSCFLRITPARTISTYGIGVGLLSILRDPFHANRSVRLQ